MAFTATVGTATPYYGQPQNGGTFTNFAGGTTTGTQVKTGEGVLYKVVINSPTAAGTITMYDGTSTSGSPMGVITVPSSPVPVSLEYNMYFKTGLFVVVASQTEDVTFIYK